MTSYHFQTVHPNSLVDLGYYTEEIMLIRFLLARDFAIKKSFEMWKHWVVWRESYRPHEISLDEPKMKELY